MSSFTSSSRRSAGTYLQENSYPEQYSSVEALLGVVALGGGDCPRMISGDGVRVGGYSSTMRLSMMKL